MEYENGKTNMSQLELPLIVWGKNDEEKIYNKL